MSLGTSEAACVYAALVLQDDGVEITADKLRALIDAAGIEVEPIWATIFAKALEGQDVGSFLMNIGAGAAAAPAAAAPAAAAAAAPAEEGGKKKKEEKKEESEGDDDMGFGLFD